MKGPVEGGGEPTLFPILQVQTNTDYTDRSLNNVIKGGI